MNNKLTRRQALKTLLAAGGSIGAASFLPARWMKPVVQSGVLPAHAQASGMASCKPLFDLKFLNYNDGDTYLCFDFVIDPDPLPTSYSVSKVSIVGTDDYAVNGPDCEEISDMPTFVGTICEYMSGTPTYVTATITFNYGETDACTPDEVTSTCAYTYKGYPVTAVPDGTPFTSNAAATGEGGPIANHFRVFQTGETEIDDTLLTNIKKLTVTITGGDALPAGSTLKLAQGSGGPYATGTMSIAGTGPFVFTNTSYWTGNRPYGGVALTVTAYAKIDDGTTKMRLDFE